MGLPKPLQEYLDIPSTEGNRNNRLALAAQQARDCRKSQEETEILLVALAVSRDGLPEREVLATIRSMFKVAPRALPYGFRTGDPEPRPTFRAKPPTARPVAPVVKYELDDEFKLPTPMLDPAKTFLNALFGDEERIQLVRAITEDGKETVSPDHQQVLTKKMWFEVIDRKKGVQNIYEAPDGPHGLYFCVNPLGKSSNRRREDNIADLRHALIEFDSLDKEKQYQLIIKSRIPCAAITDSGNKSIHAIVKINARNPAEYKERVLFLMEHFREWGVDPITKDPTRLSRLPGVVRGDSGKPQELLSLSTGCLTFEEWQAEQASSSDEMPEEMLVKDLLAFDPSSDPNSLIGDRFLCKGSSLIISGQSGIGKSSFGLQMTLCWSVGRDFFGIRAKKPLKILIVQSENDLGDMAEALQGIIKGCGFTAPELAMIHANVRIRRDTSHTGYEFISMLHALISHERPDVVLIDPLLAVVGDDIGEAKVVGEFFRRGLNAMMQVTGVIVVFMHHVPKPREDKRFQTNKDLSYSGSGSSDLTNWPRAVGVLQKIGNLDAFQFIMAKREKRTGMIDDEGNATDCIQLQHGKTGIFWERMDTGMKEAVEAERDAAVSGGRPKAPLVLTPGRLAKLKEELTKEPASLRSLSILCQKIWGKKDDRKMRDELIPMLEEKEYIVANREGKTHQFTWKT